MKTAEKKWKLPAEKVKILRWVEKQITEEPKRFDMNCLIDIYSEGAVNERPSLPRCGAVACIAGWYTLKVKGTKLKNGFWVEPAISAWDFAADDLRLRDPDSLFLTEAWPEPFHSQYVDADGAEEEVRIAVERIEHFIKTGE